MGSKSICEMIIKAKAYLAIISLQFGYSGMYIITAVCLKHGMNHFVLSVYRHITATIAIAPFALLFERPVLDQNLYYVGLKYTSATFASASVNVLPAITFIMATIFRLEKVDIRKIPSQAKIIGTIVTVAGAMLMTIYRGPVVNIFGTHVSADHAATTAAANSGQHWVVGTLFVLGSCFGWSAFFILQSYTVKEYPAELSLTAWICFMGSMEGGVVSLVMVRDMKAWALGWDSRLLASVYTGVVCSGIAYYVQSVVNRERGPVFVTVFSPLCMIITAAMGSIILHELLHLGSVIGAVIIVLGLYTVVWGKSKDSSTTTTTTTNDKGKAQELPIINNDTTINTITNKSNDKNSLDII
ncbi:hypothetical protein KSS87_018047 [Heliosperma pusillum]|nr:hypothetical protein KSS87_018047 [Heliosperma pusillum]